ncbi:MAG TPA: hypothetical protein VE778_00795 [Candidatus Bathyarchaeia archaeon]|jgi:hypothetical protein|nr:hypothetical protein [Candidatus Bathyarchaeia archaeon]
MNWLLRNAILWHRYLGLGYCLLFAAWFASGMVLLYVRVPQLTEAERLAHVPAFDLTSLRFTPSEAFVRTSLNGTPSRITLGMIGNRPAYRFLARSGTWVTVFGDDGSRLDHLDAISAVGIANTFDHQSSSEKRWVKEITAVDQWTVFDYPMAKPYLPFEIVSGNDAKRSVYYVSAASGSVYVVTTQRERIWAWFGAIPHWWYARALRAKPVMWRMTVIVGSGVGIVSCLAGLIIGLLQYSPSKRYRLPGPRRSSIPYIGWKRWHYWLGATFGLVTFTWILSGFFTMNPSNSPGPDPSDAETQSFAGGPLNPDQFHLTPQQAVTLLAHCLQPAELELITFQGKPYYLGRGRHGRTSLLAAGKDGGACLSELPSDQLLRAAQSVLPNAVVRDAAMLSGYDSYYYDDPTYSRPLPTFRVRFADSHQTWLYANPQTAQIQAVYTEHARVQRWLYEGLHDLHFSFLFRHRGIWRVTVLVLCFGGFILSVTSIILAKTYLQQRISKKSRTPERDALHLRTESKRETTTLA